jgi:DNA processing protein
MDDTVRTVTVVDDDDLAALVALAALPNLTPSRFWSLVAIGRPSRVWRQVCANSGARRGAPDAVAGWAGWSSVIDPHLELERHRRRGVEVLVHGHPGYPNSLLDDPDPPVVLFKDGPMKLDDRVRVAVVGTRRCTRYGRDIARELGASLASRGVVVVSGLAHGIDASAHAGASVAAPGHALAIVAGGIDVVYPRGNAGLWNTVATTGAVVSEWPLGGRPQRWRFPARNRLVAALSAAVVVVESAEKGGSMYTVDEALRRDRPVFAVPGSIRSPASAGTNRLIGDGALPLYQIAALVDAVAPTPSPRRRPHSSDQCDLGVDSWLLEVIGWEPMTLDGVASTSGRGPTEVNLEAERLIAAGVVRRFGGMLERVS